MVFAAFFVCWAKGWLKKGFYLTGDQAQEAECRKQQQEAENRKKKQDILTRARMSCKTKDPSEETGK